MQFLSDTKVLHHPAENEGLEDHLPVHSASCLVQCVTIR